MKLDVPLIRQAPNSVDCGLTCVEMILAYYGKAKPEDLEKMQKFPDGTYGPQLGTFLMKQGFVVEQVLLNPGLFTVHDKTLSHEDIVQKISVAKAKKVINKRALRFMREYAKAGGKFTIAIPTEQHIREEIQSKRPLIALLTSNFLLGKEGKFNFHFNVITGIDDEFVYVNDPLSSEQGGNTRIESKISCSACMHPPMARSIMVVYCA